MTKSESISYIRKCAKNVGLTFKASERVSGLYVLVCRKTGEMVVGNYTFDSAFNDACSGFIESWDGSEFAGVNCYL